MTYNDGRDPEAAAKLAAESDVVLLMVGDNPHETADRQTLGFPAIDLDTHKDRDRALHVDRDGEGRAGTAARGAARQPAHRARALHAGRRRADEGRRDDVRRDRAWQRPLRPRQADRPRRAHDLRERPREPREGERSPRLAMSAGSFASLDGKVALVTGGSRGIGRAIALELGRAGAKVVLSYRTGREEAQEVAAEIGGRAFEADVSDAASAKALVDEAGDLDVLVNNAGVTRDGVLARMSDDDWREVIDTNLSSVFYTCRARPPGR